jgi:ectoine hydroxylase
MSEMIKEPVSNDLVAGEADDYASRDGQKAKLVNRQDPVVYANEEQQPPIDQALISSYNEQGFVVLDNVFSPDEVATFQQDLERLRVDPKNQNSC